MKIKILQSLLLVFIMFNLGHAEIESKMNIIVMQIKSGVASANKEVIENELKEICFKRLFDDDTKEEDLIARDIENWDTCTNMEVNAFREIMSHEEDKRFQCCADSIDADDGSITGMIVLKAQIVDNCVVGGEGVSRAFDKSLYTADPSVDLSDVEDELNKCSQ